MKRIGARRVGFLRIVLCAVAAAGVVVTGPAAAHAAPNPSKIEDQIDEQWNKLEPVIEEYNDVHSKLKELKKQQKELAATLAPLQKKVDAAMVQVRGLAVDAYIQGPPSAMNAMLVTGSPTGLVDKLTLLDQIASRQEASITEVAKLRDKYAADKADVDKMAAEIAVRDKDLSAKKTTIEAKVEELQDLRIEAYGSATVSKSGLKIGPCPVDYTNDRGGRAAQKACDLIGKPYVFGAEGPSSYDCSGLTKEAWGSVGVSLYHYTKTQWSTTKSVSRSELQPGDLIFYGSDLHHVSIYVGGGMMVHAPHTGDYVRMAKIESPGSIAGYRRPA
ncbi:MULTISPECIES: C40 family peptidase [Actinoplanes]|uniref:C40 family peptidase n=1 Tax=Actinoplanes TaxID=1865 RepID=UPI0006991B74|nr:MULTISPECIES: C40 family peptidase [Actinoplanes]GLY08357.1 hypothetical protein Acsp01_87360 [Actinoplanes sp. NBRC 101535]